MECVADEDYKEVHRQPPRQRAVKSHVGERHGHWLHRSRGRRRKVCLWVGEQRAAVARGCEGNGSNDDEGASGTEMTKQRGADLLIQWWDGSQGRGTRERKWDYTPRWVLICEHCNISSAGRRASDRWHYQEDCSKQTKPNKPIHSPYGFSSFREPLSSPPAPSPQVPRVQQCKALRWDHPYTEPTSSALSDFLHHQRPK